MSRGDVAGVGRGDAAGVGRVDVASVGRVDVARGLRHHSLVVPWLRRPGARILLPGWLAITIGPVVVSWRALDPPELAHELEHVRQWRRHGLLFIPRYLDASRAAGRRGGDRYLDNPFEVAARRAADRTRTATAPGTPATMFGS